MGLDLRENIRMAMEGLRANKMRSLLTMLGIIIGIGSVIGILTVGEGLSSTITGEMAALGAQNISVYFQERVDDYGDNLLASMTSWWIDEEDAFTDDMFAALQAQYPDLVGPVALDEGLGGGQVNKGRDYANIYVYGVNENYLPLYNIEVIAGRNLRAKDNEGARNVAVVSDKLVNNMFDGDIQGALGQEVQATVNGETYTYTIVGVYEYKQNAMMSAISTASDKDISTELYVPLNTVKRITGTMLGRYQFATNASLGQDSQAVASLIQDFLNRYYANNQDFQVGVLAMETMTDMVSSTMDTLSIAISVIAGISLLVGGIGVMNIMLVSVTERTREIGTRKALGATNGNIRTQFVVESVIICLVGGLIGILVGAALGYLGSSLLDAPSGPTLGSILLAFGFSMAIGVFFGYYPANKAANLDPIEALRYE